MLTDPTYHSNGTHTPYGQQVKVAVPEDLPHGNTFDCWNGDLLLTGIGAFLMGIVPDKKCHAEDQHKAYPPQNGKCSVPVIHGYQLGSQNGNHRSPGTNA